MTKTVDYDFRKVDLKIFKKGKTGFQRHIRLTDSKNRG